MSMKEIIWDGPRWQHPTYGEAIRGELITLPSEMANRFIARGMAHEQDKARTPKAKTKTQDIETGDET